VTLVPLALGLALAALGLARRATPAIGVTLAIAGILLPVVGVAWLAAEVSAGFPLEIAFWGGATTWLAIYARADALATYTGLGVSALVTPLLVWVAWRAAPPDARDELSAAPAADSPDGTTDEAASTASEVEVTDEADDEAGASAAEASSEDGTEGEAEDGTEDTARPPAVISPRAPTRLMGRWQWAGVALALALESALLSLVFAENILWLALTWLAVIGISWALGELGSDPQTFDWKGLTLMAVPPVIWLAPILLVALSVDDQRLIDLTGASKFSLWQVLVMTVAVALAAGAWPALGWVRKRASITAPAGLGAAILAVIPAALFIGARTFGLTQTVASRWPAFTLGQPPITAGVAIALLGAVTTLFAGLLALGRRDGRGLLASCALVSAGWGLVGLGVGSALAALGVTLLLTTSTLGLGAMLASLVASGAVTADIEPDSAGPRVFGEKPRPAALFAWVVGAASMVGLPLFAGYLPLQIISAASLPLTRLIIPLIGLAWGGSALLLIGLLRATAPAFTVFSPPAPLASEPADGDETLEEEEDAAQDEPVAAPTRTGGAELQAADLPGVALGALALLAGIAPSALLIAGAIPAASAFIQQSALNGLTQAQLAGYSAGAGQWLATPAALAAVVVALALALIRWRLPRLATATPLYLSGQAAGAPAEEEDDAEELAGLSEPGDAWEDLRPAMTAGWLTPGGAWLGGISDELGAGAPGLEKPSVEEEEPPSVEESEDVEVGETSADESEATGAASAPDIQDAEPDPEPEEPSAAEPEPAIEAEPGVEPELAVEPEPSESAEPEAIGESSGTAELEVALEPTAEESTLDAEPVPLAEPKPSGGAAEPEPQAPTASSEELVDDGQDHADTRASVAAEASEPPALAGQPSQPQRSGQQVQQGQPGQQGSRKGRGAKRGKR
jgi:NADH:ubiquinone oxidoreductase subunit 5 (subunit L)/multisubunit Na+/H+ antiporter MnhA subunit